MSYRIHEINKEIIQILDEYDGCIYLIKGQDKSIVFDLGMSRESIKPIIDSLLDTPYDVICSHGHVDHVGRSGEFHKVFMSLYDKDVYLENYQLNDPQEQFNIIGLSLIDKNQIEDVKTCYDLGDRMIKIVPCYGHTPGSILLVDSKNQTVLTGDAIGSGCGVWMQVDDALSIQDYLYSLQKCYQQLMQFQIDDEWLFLGGHAYQEYQSQVSQYNRLDIHLLEDMITLCTLLLHQDIAYRTINTHEFSTGQPYYASYQKAEIIFTLSQLKKC